MNRQLPRADELTRHQYDGRACVWCGMPLWRNAVSAGIARGSVGAVVLDIEVYACPACSTAKNPQTPARSRTP